MSRFTIVIALAILGAAPAVHADQGFLKGTLETSTEKKVVYKLVYKEKLKDGDYSDELAILTEMVDQASRRVVGKAGIEIKGQIVTLTFDVKPRGKNTPILTLLKYSGNGIYYVEFDGVIREADKKRLIKVCEGLSNVAQATIEIDRNDGTSGTLKFYGK